MTVKNVHVTRIVLLLVVVAIVIAVIIGYSMFNSRETELKAEETPPVELESVETPSPEKLSATTLDENNTADTESEDEIGEALLKIFNEVYEEAHTNIQGRFNSWLTYELSILQEIGEQENEESYISWRETNHADEEDVIFTDTDEVYYVINKQGIEVKQNWLYDDAEVLSTIKYADKVIVTGIGVAGTSTYGWVRIETEDYIGYIKFSGISSVKPKIEEPAPAVNNAGQKPSVPAQSSTPAPAPAPQPSAPPSQPSSSWSSQWTGGTIIFDPSEVTTVTGGHEGLIIGGVG